MKKTRPTATMEGQGSPRVGRFILAWWPLAPAIVVNTDWSGRTPIGWVLAGVAGIIMAAVFIDAARRAPEWCWKPVLFGIALFGMCLNMAVVMKTASVASEDDSHARKVANLAADNSSSLRSQWSKARNAAAEVV